MKNMKKQSIYATAALAFLISAGVSVTASAEEISDIEVPVTEVSTISDLNSILNLKLESSDIHVGDLVRVDVVMDNITNIAAEDLIVKYDSSKLEFSGHYRITEGLIPAGMKTSDGEVRYILASKGEANVINSQKVLLRMYFTAKEAGDAKVEITNGKVSDGIEMERTLTEEECDKITINILENE